MQLPFLLKSLNCSIVLYNVHNNCVCVCVCVCVCESLGGLAAVIYTDVLQTLIMVVGSFALMFIGRVHYHM